MWSGKCGRLSHSNARKISSPAIIASVARPGPDQVSAAGASFADIAAASTRRSSVDSLARTSSSAIRRSAFSSLVCSESAV